MFKSIKKIFFIGCICSLCCFAPTGCRSYDYHQSEDDQWLIEQVEKGYLTEQEYEDIISSEYDGDYYRPIDEEYPLLEETNF